MHRSEIEIARFRPEDRADWEVLSRGYKTFYRTALPDSRYDETWQRLLRDEEIHGLAAHLDGIVHYLFHPHVWMGDSCYLQDLFVAEAARGHGVARALIERVAAAARERCAPRLYWQTQEDNARARTLFDKLARFDGFIRYDCRLE